MTILEDYSLKITCITLILVVKVPLYANIRSGNFDCNIIALQWMTLKGKSTLILRLFYGSSKRKEKGQ